MGFSKGGPLGEFKTKSPRFTVGVGLVVDLEHKLPRVFDEQTMGGKNAFGFPMSGRVVAVLGAKDNHPSLTLDSIVTVTVRPGDSRQAIFSDIERTKEPTRFLLEGVTSTAGRLEARWVHGAGSNRAVEELEIVGPALVTFENPDPADGPKNGFLRLNLDGTPTVFDERRSDGVFMSRQFSFDQVVARFERAVQQDLKFRISQRVLVPSASASVCGQDDLEAVLTAFRNANFTSCVVRSFVAGTLDCSKVDVQILSWPADIAPNGDFQGLSYAMPALDETKRFVELRDSAEDARMEVIPGYMLNLIGNKDASKSTKHKFAHDVIKGLSDKQKAMYGAQNYGPGISISAMGESGLVNGLTRMALRTEGPQYRNLMMIPSPHFLDADKIEIGRRTNERVTESGAQS